MKNLKLRKVYVFTLIIFAWLLSVMHSALGQTASAKYVVDSKPGVSCELNSAYLDNLIAEAKKNKERIFVISRTNMKEKYRVNRYRLEAAYDYITTREVPPREIVVAIGERTSEKKGRLEFYLGSQLYLVSLAENGKPICLTCCDSP